MKAKNRFLKILIALFSLLLLVGCIKTNVNNPNNPNSSGGTYEFSFDKNIEVNYDNDNGLTVNVSSDEDEKNSGQSDDEDSDDEGSDSDEDSDSNDDSDSVDDSNEVSEATKENSNSNDSNNESKENDETIEVPEEVTDPFEPYELTVKEDGEYTTKEEVALYIHTYNHLPSNFITKDEATELGWISSKGNLGKVAPGKSIGGDKFGNREGLLPKKKGRTYYECDINFDGTFRNGERIVFSDDGLIYYTGDHYESFELLYE